MSLRKSPRLTPEFLAANRLNAKKSTGPRSPLGKARVSVNALRHGLRSRSFRDAIFKTGEPAEEFDHVAIRLHSLLRPGNRTQAARMVRYAEMLWAINRRVKMSRSHPARRRTLLAISEPERRLHKQVLRDLTLVWARSRYKDRWRGNSMLKVMRSVDLMPGWDGKN